MCSEFPYMFIIQGVDMIIYENESVAIDSMDSGCETLKHRIGLFFEKY